MKENKKINLDKITLESLKGKLRSMPKPEVPVTLRERLLKSVRRRQVKKSYLNQFRQGFGIWGFSASAAIVMILIFIFTLNFNTSIPSHQIIADLNDGLNNSPNDLNDAFIDDSNYTSFNMLRLNIENPSTLFLK